MHKEQFHVLVSDPILIARVIITSSLYSLHKVWKPAACMAAWLCYTQASQYCLTTVPRLRTLTLPQVRLAREVEAADALAIAAGITPRRPSKSPLNGHKRRLRSVITRPVRLIR